MQNVQIVYLLLFLSSISFALASGYVALCFLFKPLSSLVFIDQRLSACAQKKIQDNIYKIKPHELTNKEFYTTIAQEFPEVKEVAIKYTSFLKAYVYIKVAVPVLALVDEMLTDDQAFIVTDQGTVVHKSHYTPDLVQDVPVVFFSLKAQKDLLDINSTMNDYSFKCLRALSSEMYEQFKITWIDKTEIQLQLKSDKNLVIIADPESVGDMRKILYAQHIYGMKKGNNHNIRVDIRLGDFIVCTHL